MINGLIKRHSDQPIATFKILCEGLLVLTTSYDANNVIAKDLALEQAFANGIVVLHGGAGFYRHIIGMQHQELDTICRYELIWFIKDHFFGLTTFIDLYLSQL
jgi:hypothetical protein